MSKSQLPEHPSLEYLRKLAKNRLRELRATNPKAKLASAQLAIARDYGFTSWRALKAEVERRLAGANALFFDACAKGDIDAVRGLLADNPDLVRATNAAAPHAGWTGLHSAAQHGHLNLVRLLLERGADPNAREAGDHTYPLHWAAAHRHVDVVRALLDAGGDVHGTGDDHELAAIGWATFFHKPGEEAGSSPEVASILAERGARHHIFSAMSLGDLHLIRSSKDLSGHTALESAMLRGDREATKRLRAAGGKEPRRMNSATVRTRMNKLARSIKKCSPMIYVPDVAAAIDWYVSIGFEEVTRYSDDGIVNFGIVAFGPAEVMLNMHGKCGDHDVSLWLSTDKIDDLYRLLKSRQIEAAATGAADGIDFIQHINDTFYGARQFGIRDLNGYILYFIQQLRG